MNDDYDKHLIQKYRLAVAIAIIKNTPENITPKEYLERLKNNLLPEMEFYDPNLTICEDDFNFNDDDCKINDNDKNNNHIKDGDTDHTQYDSQTNDSITILKDFDFNEMRNINNDKDTMEDNSVCDVLKILTGADEEYVHREVHGDVNSINHSQSTYYETSQSLLQPNANIGQTQKFIEFAYAPRAAQYENSFINNDTINPRKEISLTENATNSQKTNTFYNYTDNLTHVSQSQVDIIVPRYLIEKKKSTSSVEEGNINNNEKQTNASGSKKHKCDIQKKNTPIEAKRSKIVDNKITSDTETAYFKEIKNNAQNTIENKINSKTETAYLEEIKNNFNIHASGSNREMNLNNSFKSGPNSILKKLFKSSNTVNDSLYGNNEIIDTNFNKDTRNSENDRTETLDIFMTSHESNSKPKIAYKSQEFNSELSNNNAEGNIEEASLTREDTDAKEESEEEQIKEDLFDKLTDSQAEVVPFKVLEELNKVKSFLNKRSRRISSECVSDSGYKSDSQSRSSLKSALQSTNTSLNQSAHCLLSYVTQCPLVMSTEEITNEISKTLGRLIDRLHEEEKYPSFLEEHLQIVDSLLTDIYEKESADKLLEKDEKIHRLFLLNKSSHIIKYTTEKIISILEELNTILTQDELLETSRTIQTENLSYIFHILETLIKKLVIYRKFSSQQSTQNSQEDEVMLKRSSITDIWRRKWNPDKRCDSNPDTSMKPCIITRCSEVLNKFIVQSMDGYSLVSYFALQCFNILQN